MADQQVVLGHVEYAPDYKSAKSDWAGKPHVIDVQRLQRIAELARPVLQWDRDKAEAWLPGLYDVLKALE